MPTAKRHETLQWMGGADGHLRLIDQTLLPAECRQIDCRDMETTWEAIKQLRVRGAPAIGIAAAYGVCLGMQSACEADRASFDSQLEAVVERLAESRPTAVNLFWALDRIKRVAQTAGDDSSSSEVLDALLAEARLIHDEDRTMCHAIGRHGAELIVSGDGLLTHCNAGGLATAELGTALAVFYTAHQQGKKIHVFVDETRPLLQGSRLTAWELQQHGVPATLICDSMAAQVMKEGRVQAVVTGADRIAANGDSANKIGTYSLAVLARAHGIRFYIAAPTSTFDLALEGGDEIPIEQRSADEITHGFGRQTAPDGVAVYNPAFDVTPAELIDALITERGVISPVNKELIAAHLAITD